MALPDRAHHPVPAQQAAEAVVDGAAEDRGHAGGPQQYRRLGQPDDHAPAHELHEGGAAQARLHEVPVSRAAWRRRPHRRRAPRRPPGPPTAPAARPRRRPRRPRPRTPPAEQRGPAPVGIPAPPLRRARRAGRPSITATRLRRRSASAALRRGRRGAAPVGHDEDAQGDGSGHQSGHVACRPEAGGCAGDAGERGQGRIQRSQQPAVPRPDLAPPRGHPPEEQAARSPLQQDRCGVDLAHGSPSPVRMVDPPSGSRTDAAWTPLTAGLAAVWDDPLPPAPQAPSAAAPTARAAPAAW